MNGALDAAACALMAHRVCLVAELHVDPLEDPEVLAHSGIGLGLTEITALTIASAGTAGTVDTAPRLAPTHSHSHSATLTVVSHHRDTETAAATVAHGAVRKLPDRHRDRVHGANTMSLVVAIEPREA